MQPWVYHSPNFPIYMIIIIKEQSAKKRSKIAVNEKYYNVWLTLDN